MMPPFPNQQLATGIAGLDEVLLGGLPRGRVYLVEGQPGSGKTTLGLQFLMAGAARGERCLYISVSETEEEVRGSAATHGWDLAGIDLRELGGEDAPLADEGTTLFHPSELQLKETAEAILKQVEEHRPSRVVLDSLSELRLLGQDPFRFRKQLLSLKRYLQERGCTALLLDDRTATVAEGQLQSVAHGVIEMLQTPQPYGRVRRTVRVAKLRGVPFREGYHDLRIRTGGVQVYSRLVATEHEGRSPEDLVSSGVAELDALLGGGLPRGSATVVIGPSGVGKSAIVTRYAEQAAVRGERAAMFCFDERPPSLFARARGLGMPMEPYVESGHLLVRQVDPGEVSPGEFGALIREAVEEQGCALVVIDSLNGYLSAMVGSEYLELHLHELIGYLASKGVSCFLVVGQAGFMGGSMVAPVDLSYLADTALLLRYFEADGAVRRALSVVKHRAGKHESTIRDFRLGPDGLVVGEALDQFQGVLSGVPRFVGDTRSLLNLPESGSGSDGGD